MERSSLEPKPPPTAVGTMRTALSSRPRIAATSLRRHVRRLRTGLDFDSIADATSETCFGLDVSVFDKPGFIFGFDDNRRFAQCAFHIAMDDVTAHKNVVRPKFVNGLRAGKLRFGGCQQGRELLPRHRERCRIESCHRWSIANNGCHGFTAVARYVLGKNRLIGKIRMHAKAIFAGDIAGGKDSLEARRFPNKLLQIPEREFRVSVGRADDEQDQGIFGPLVRTVNILAGDFAMAVEAHKTLADWTRRIASECRYRLGVRFHHRANNFAVAGAATEDSPEGIFDFGFRRRRIFFQQRNGGDKHAGSADAALRRAVLKERFLEAVELRGGFAEAFDGLDFGVWKLANGGEAGAHGFAIDENRARAAIAGIAADLGPSEAKLFAQNGGEARARIGLHGDGLAVQRDRQFGEGGLHRQRTLPAQSASDAADQGLRGFLAIGCGGANIVNWRRAQKNVRS